MLEVKSQKYLMQEVLEKCSQLSIPAQAVLELTYRCNLHCVHCYVDVEEPDELSIEEWKDIIDQLKRAGTIYLLLTGGEIMLRADFLEIAAYARRNGFFIGLLTNFTLLDSGMAQDIAELKPFSITTSLYGGSALTHDSITQVAGSYEKTLEGIRLLVSYGLVPVVQTLVMKTNLNELDKIRNTVEKIGAKASIDLGIAPSKTGANYPLKYEPNEEELIMCGWLPNTSDEFQSNSQGPCKAGKSLCSVSPNGSVYPCTNFPLKLGSLRNYSFDKIWKLETCAELRYLRSMRHTDLHACNQCELSVYCRRCMGLAYLESGRLDGPSSSGCRHAKMRWRLRQAAEVKQCQKNLM